MIDETHYREWLGYIFGDGAENPDLEEKYETHNPDDLVELIRLTCVRCGADLKNFSNQHISRGLFRLFDPSHSNLVFAFKECDLHYKDIVIALQSMWHLYIDLFNERCDPVLSHLDEPTDNPLNAICYMLWDVTPLAYWDEDHPDSKHYYAAIAAVMEKALSLSNPACIESALHGLGHIQDETPDRVKQIIDGFLKKRKFGRPELAHYANNAKIGYVQ